MRVLSCLALALCIGASAARADVYDDACAYFHARAESGEGNTVFRRHLSRQCGVVLLTYKASAPGTEARLISATVLNAMRDFRAVLEDIPLARLARTHPRHALSDVPDLLRRPVSASGEVLIARVIGVTPRLDAWESWRMSRR